MPGPTKGQGSKPDSKDAKKTQQRHSGSEDSELREMKKRMESIEEILKRMEKSQRDPLVGYNRFPFNTDRELAEKTAMLTRMYPSLLKSDKPTLFMWPIKPEIEKLLTVMI